MGEPSILDRIPPLAGLCTRAEAARVGLSVEENVRRLVRYHWVEKRTMEIMVGRIASTPEWEVKGALSLHVWLTAERAEALRRRITEMRSPAPRLDVPPDARLETALAEIGAAHDTVELLTGLYGVLLPELAEAYRRHVDETNPLVDHPTRRMLRRNLLDLDDTLAWGGAALEAFGEHEHVSRPAEIGAEHTSAARRDEVERSRAPARAGGPGGDGAFEVHVRAYLHAAGGIAGGAATLEALPAARAPGAPAPDFRPRRDARFGGMHNFNFPPHVIAGAANVSAEERNLALLCKRLLEMDVPEMMCSFMSERADCPWGFHLDYARQLWDEARHSMMGEVALEARGVDWRAIPLNVGFALRLNLHAEPLERQIVLWAIEQSLMPGDTGKRAEHRTALEAGDDLSAHFHDYDWADEVLHAQIGRRWLLGAEGEGLGYDEAMERARLAHERTWAALEEYRALEPQTDWWSGFVRHVTGRDTEATPDQLVEDPTVVAE